MGKSIKRQIYVPAFLEAVKTQTRLGAMGSICGLTHKSRGCRRAGGGGGEGGRRNDPRPASRQERCATLLRLMLCCELSPLAHVCLC